ncbi:hypothetical protein CMV_022529 [Castanea mollissima]|uniref:RNase H type-1 domain-containing protein n=1 Tax=Castanea mollissima TaxID=60419 RepID=A0A8J4QSD6_9ROSI|nr:hypothetical protein CMV_022529 [Castanea mollissima]
MHILRNCEVIKQVWRNLGINSDDNTFFAADLLSWFTVNAKANAGNYRGQPHWSTIFLFAVWSIWLKRNAVVLHNKPFPIDLHFEVLQRVEEFYCAANWKAPTQSVHKPIRWEKPPTVWIKLNTDGSSSGDLGLAGGGGVFRNEEGEWILGYSRHIGITSDVSVKFPRSPLTLAKPISPPTSLIRHSHVAGETLLSNPPSTIPDPPKTDLVLDPPKTDLVAAFEDRSR